ncbi:hypothetical protein [Streptomyces agglomeratus]|uniref:hypothetical protein n=1 Tax=Streptomyces agglomeratus TaxID=285458 RepID=UPI00159F0BDF|nr:hypothetical protein [Streptomyces agglomeratus]
MPVAVDDTISEIVEAVRAGDDPRIQALLTALAHVADMATLIVLRSRLDEALRYNP